MGQLQRLLASTVCMLEIINWTRSRCPPCSKARSTSSSTPFSRVGAKQTYYDLENEVETLGIVRQSRKKSFIFSGVHYLILGMGTPDLETGAGGNGAPSDAGSIEYNGQENAKPDGPFDRSFSHVLNRISQTGRFDPSDGQITSASPTFSNTAQGSTQATSAGEIPLITLPSDDPQKAAAQSRSTTAPDKNT